MSADPIESHRGDTLAEMVDTTRRFRGAWAGMDNAVRQLNQTMARERRRILLAAYRTGVLPWPIPASTCRYPHRARWAGRAPQRRKKR